MTDIEEIVSCSICMEIFEKPRVLPCQHTFCEHCLTEYITEKVKHKQKGGLKFPCPLCREKIAVGCSDHYGASFPLNLTVIALCDIPEVVKSTQEEEGNDEEFDDSEEVESKEDHHTKEIISESDHADEFDDDTIKLDNNDVFADVIVDNIIIPISLKNCSNWKISRAVVSLFLCMVFYCVFVQIIFACGVKVLLAPSLFSLIRNIFKEVKNRDMNKETFKLCLFHFVIHMSSCVLIAILLLFTLLGACAIERIITTATNDPLSVNNMASISRESLVMARQSIRNLHRFWKRLSLTLTM